MRWVFYNIFAITTLIASTILAMSGQDGWGWFLFAAIITASTPVHKGGNDVVS